MVEKNINIGVILLEGYSAVNKMHWIMLTKYIQLYSSFRLLKFDVLVPVIQ